MLPRPLLTLSVFGSILGLADSARGQRVLLEVKSPVPAADAVSPVFIGDWDGDGVEDLAIGAARDSTVANLAGAARVHSGADGSELAAFYGTNAVDYFGAFVARMPDMDGDGVDELAVSAPNADNSGTDTGSVFVYAGRTGALLLQIDCPSVYKFFGVPMGPIDDVDGDGIVDLFVSHQGTGSLVHVMSGADGSELTAIQGPAGEEFGYDVCAIHDVDADGVNDLLVGARRHQTVVGAMPIGAAYVVSPVSGTFLRWHFGAHFIEMHGSGTAAVRDLDGDGVDDYVVTSAWDDNVVAAMARVYSGATGNAIGKITNFDARTHLDTQVTGAGDLNGDGFGDFALAGLWYDEKGLGRSAAFLISGRTQLLLDRIETVDVGFVLESAIDFDQDGFDDLAVGIIDSALDGSVRVYSGDDLWLNATKSRPLKGNTLDFAVREGPAAGPVVLVLEDVDGTPYFQIVNGLGQFDATGGYAYAAVVPAGLAGHDMLFRAYAHDANGKLIQSARQDVHFK
jgi:hypothetical protein